MTWQSPGAIAQDASVKAEANAKPRGLLLTLKRGDVTDARRARFAALHVPAEQAVTPKLESIKQAGPFTATFTGWLNLPLRSRVYFSVAGRGKFKLTIADDVVLEGEGDDLSKIEESGRQRLGKGENTFVLEYTPPATGDATVRVYWRGRDFPKEPMPPFLFTHDGKDKTLLAAKQWRDGRQLFAESRCVKCHQPADDALLGSLQGGMSELKADAPDLSAIGSRVNAPWLAEWIVNPRAVRHNATMPNLLGHADVEAAIKAKDRRAWDIAAYLATLSPPDAKPEPVRGADAEAVRLGGELYAKLGCFNCHVLPSKNVPEDERQRFSLSHVARKFKPGALRDFLREPNKHYRWVRMPHFKLSEVEATQLSSFLRADALKGAQGKEHAAEVQLAGDPVKGKTLVQSLGCVSCHNIEPKLTSTHEVKSFEEMSTTDWSTTGCASPKKQTFFDFSKDEQAALHAFRKELPTLTRDSPAEFAERQVGALQCNVCHTRDSLDDRWSKLAPTVAHLLPKVVEDDFAEEDNKGEPKVAQDRPSLTHLGDKLHGDWVERFIAGELNYKPRPWLHARMPAFPSRAKGLAIGLTQQHGRSFGRPEAKKPDAAMAKVGRTLVGQVGGFSCNACHAVGPAKAVAPFEVEALNLKLAKDRLRHEYFLRWMLNPIRVTPGTKMPKYAADDGYTPLTDHYGGDAAKQFDAIWQYLLAGEKIVPPGK